MDRRLRKRFETYWREQRALAVNALAAIDINSWFDLWHTHIDWQSKGNRSDETRGSAAELTVSIFLLALEKAAARVEPYQCWAMFCENTGDNAVYLHTNNPNRMNFPYKFEDTDWGVAPPSYLSSGQLSDEFEIGLMRFAGEQSYIARRRA